MAATKEIQLILAAYNNSDESAKGRKRGRGEAAVYDWLQFHVHIKYNALYFICWVIALSFFCLMLRWASLPISELFWTLWRKGYRMSNFRLCALHNVKSFTSLWCVHTWLTWQVMNAMLMPLCTVLFRLCITLLYHLIEYSAFVQSVRDYSLTYY